ncbi:MAG TPA: hypothetical protein PL196_00070 [Burkholderiaceae bacterium]|nr:hypothetical protein [Burkholderiaceae bacterium]
MAYPSTLPLAMLEKTREQPAVFQMAQPRRGYGYVEPTGTDTPLFWQLRWVFTGAQAQAFRQWFVYVTQMGVLPFSMSVRTEFGLESFDMQFLPDGLLPAKQLGTDVWEYSATVMARSIVVPAVDAQFANVLILANGAGLTVDSSPYARSLTTSGGIALDSTYTLNSANTYRIPPSGRLDTADFSAIATLLGAGEWCLEFWMRYVSASFGIEGTVYSGIGTISVTPGRLVHFVNSSPTVDIQASAALPSGAFGHVAIIRDNTTDASNARYHIAIGGTVSATTAGTLSKSTTEAGTSTHIMGFDVNSPTVAFGGLRLTRGTRRYLTNVEGAAVNTFTPDAYPFALGVY